MKNIAGKTLWLFILSLLLLYFACSLEIDKGNHKSLNSVSKDINNCKPQSFISTIKSDIVTSEERDLKLLTKAKGMIRKIETSDPEKVLFLTFDACGQGGLSDGYDSLLVDYLIKEQIPATFFISRRWALKNIKYLDYIIENGVNIDIQNHGTQHIPLSSVGDSVYSVVGTKGLREVHYEVETAAVFLCEKLGEKPKLFRPGTAHADDIAVSYVNAMGYQVISYSVLGDGGATFTKELIKENILKAKNGDIILLHFNHPESDVFLGVNEAVEELRKMGNIKFGIIYDYLSNR